VNIIRNRILGLIYPNPGPAGLKFLLFNRIRYNKLIMVWNRGLMNRSKIRIIWMRIIYWNMI